MAVGTASVAAQDTQIESILPPSSRNPAGRGMPEAVRMHLGSELKTFYATIHAEPQPDALLNLIARLAIGPTPATSAAGDEFRAELMAALPGLRAFAVSLAINPTAADDLVQETLLKAWANRDRFEPGSNLMAWLCTILRNQFYTECRKRRREVEDADGAAAAQLIVLPSQEHGIELQKVWAILATMPATQREALLLVAGQGLTCEAAAALVGSQTGTMKSRVSRARAFLVDSLGLKSSQAAIELRRSSVARPHKVALPWYAAEHYEALRQSLSDGDKLPMRYEAWRVSTEQVEREIQRSGIEVVRVLIEPDGFAAWCERVGLPADGTARARYATEALAV